MNRVDSLINDLKYIKRLTKKRDLLISEGEKTSEAEKAIITFIKNKSNNEYKFKVDNKGAIWITHPTFTGEETDLIRAFIEENTI